MNLDEATNYLCLFYGQDGLLAYRFSDPVAAVEFAQANQATANGSDVMLFKVQEVEFAPDSNRTPADAG